MQDKQDRLTFLVALELYGDDLQLAITFILADVEPSSVASFGDHFGRGHMRHYPASGGSTDAVLARRLRDRICTKTLLFNTIAILSNTV